MPDGTSNDWGPNSNGFIGPNELSQMDWNETIDAYEKNYSLAIGSQHLYKIHFHPNSSGTNYSWIPDPLKPEITDDEWNNSILDYLNLEIPKDYFGESFKPAIDGNDFAGRGEIIGNITTTRSFKDMMGKPTEGYWLRNKDWFFQWNVTKGKKIIRYKNRCE